MCICGRYALCVADSGIGVAVLISIGVGFALLILIFMVLHVLVAILLDSVLVLLRYFSPLWYRNCVVHW